MSQPTLILPVSDVVQDELVVRIHCADAVKVEIVENDGMSMLWWRRVATQTDSLASWIEMAIHACSPRGVVTTRRSDCTG